MPARSVARIWCVLILIAAGSLSYLNSLPNPFVLDDEGNITGNAQIRSLLSRAVLTPERELSTAGRPVANVSLAINYALGGTNVAGYHAGNLAIHLACALVLLALLRRLLRRLAERAPPLPLTTDDVAFCIALLWVVHPLNSEVINYVTQRTESLMALGLLMTVYGAIRSAEGGRAQWQAFSVAACALGMGAKESMVVAPILVVLVDRIVYFGSWRELVRSRWRFYLALAATWLVLAALLRTDPRGASAGFSSSVSPWTYLLNQAPLIVRYLRLTVWPSSLVAVYGWPRELSISAVDLPALIVLTLLAATLVALWKRPPIGLAGAWLFITLAPTSSIVPIATEVGAERRMYLGSMAVLTLLVLGGLALLTRVTSRRPDWDAVGTRRAALTAVSICAVFLSAVTIARNREYRSERVLLESSLARYPTPVAHHVLGERLLADGERASALTHLRQAVPGAPRAHYTLGVELFKDGDYNGAIEHLQAFIKEQPRLVWIVDAHGYLGQSFAAQGNHRAAIRSFQEVLEITPGSLAACRFMADSLAEVGDYDLAATYYRRYLNAVPNDSDVLNSLGLVLASRNKFGEAIPAFRRATETNPSNGRAFHNLALSLAQTGQLQEAVTSARVAKTIQPDDVETSELLTTLLKMQGTDR